MTIDRLRRKAGLRAVAAAVLLVGTSLPVWADEELAEAPPEIPADATFTEFDDSVFSPDPVYEEQAYDADAQWDIYGGKTAIDAPRPLIEWGNPLYQVGEFGDDYAFMGTNNLMRPGLRAYGDLRTAVAFNNNGGDEVGQVATRLNLDIDLMLTATERIHAFFRPLDQDNKFTRYEFAGNDSEDGFSNEFNGIPQNLYFEGDMGAIFGGLTGTSSSVDIPFAAGLVPLLFQNGIWVDDAFVGGAVTIPAKNSPSLDITNYDITFFAGFDKVTNPGIVDAQGGLADDDLNIYGVTGFFEANKGYWEAGFGAVEGKDSLKGEGFYSATLAFSRRYGGWLSNSIRGFYLFGQNPANGAPQTADGYALLVENSFVSSQPLVLVPYFNAFIGVDNPQPLARNKGLLKNTGINFDTDDLTGFPKLDDTANNTFGGALGVEYLFNLDRQIVVELAGQKAYGDANGRSAPGDQLALGLRYQQPLSLAWIVQANAMYGVLQNADNISGFTLELRRKF